MSDYETDEQVARRWLMGFLTSDEKGPPRTHYIQSDSPEEKQARSAIARLLRGQEPLSGDIRGRLAELVDVDDGLLGPASDRKLVFRQRRRGRRPQSTANTQIARHIWDRRQSGWNVESAVIDAIERYKLSREQVYHIWGRYRPIFEATKEPFEQVQPNP